MSLNAILAGMGSPIEDAARHARSFSDLQALSDKQVAAERSRVQYLRDEEARRREMEQVEGPEALPGGAPASMVAGMPTAAAAPTFASTPVPDAQRNQYIARNVTPQVTPNQSDAESARLARQAPLVRTFGEPIDIAGVAGQQRRLAELRAKNPVPAPSAGGNESMAEANRINANQVPAATEAAPRAVDAQSAIGRVLGREGGFVDDPVDRGGKTKFGISQRAYPKLDIANLTEQQAAAIYKRDYWDAINADSLPEGVREMAFDAAVNQGVQWTKEALAASGGDPAKFLQMRRDRYQSIVAADPSQAKFLKGWTNRLNEFGQPAAAPTQTAVAPTQPAAAPATAAAPAQAPAQPAAGQMFSPEQITQVAAATQQELRMTEMRLAEINRQLSYAPTLEAATRLRAQANDLRFGAFNAQLKNAAVQASTGNQQAVAQLATAAGVQYAQTPQGYVAAQLNPATGQYVATTQPAPLEQFVNTLYSEATGAAAKLRAAQQEATMKAQGEIAVERVKTEGRIYETQAAAQRDLQKLIAERRLTENDIKGLEFDPVKGTLYKRTNTGVEVLVPGQSLGGGMMSEPRFVPI